MNSTDKLLWAILIVVLISTIFHPTLPNFICAFIHIVVTIITAVIHFKEIKIKALALRNAILLSPLLNLKTADS